MSGRAVEAAGDVDVLLLDKTGTITLGDRQATAFLPATGVDEPRSSPTLPSSPRLQTRRPKAARIMVLAKQQFSLRERDLAVAQARRSFRSPRIPA